MLKKVDGKSFQILSFENGKHLLLDAWQLNNVTIEGVSYTEVDAAVSALNAFLYAASGGENPLQIYSTNEVLTGGVWIDGKPIYRIVLTKVVNTQTDAIPFDFENKEIIRQEVLFQDYMNCGIGHYNQFQFQPDIDIDIDLRAYLYPDDGALNIRNIITSNDVKPFYPEVKVIAIIEYTKTTD